MSRIIEFKIATTKGVESARGLPAWFTIGKRKIKFVLQYDYDGRARWLTHFASGYKLGRLDDAAVELMCKLSPYHRFTKHMLAKALIEKCVSRMGAEKVLASIDSVRVINGETK